MFLIKTLNISDFTKPKYTSIDVLHSLALATVWAYSKILCSIVIKIMKNYERFYRKFAVVEWPVLVTGYIVINIGEAGQATKILPAVTKKNKLARAKLGRHVKKQAKLLVEHNDRVSSKKRNKSNHRKLFAPNMTGCSTTKPHLPLMKADKKYIPMQRNCSHGKQLKTRLQNLNVFSTNQSILAPMDEGSAARALLMLKTLFDKQKGKMKSTFKTRRMPPSSDDEPEETKDHYVVDVFYFIDGNRKMQIKTTMSSTS